MTLLSLAYVSFLLLLMAFLLWFLLMFIFSDIVSTASGAPFVPMGERFVRSLLDFGDLSADDVFYDLGCGDGRVLMSAVRDFHVRSATGYDVGWFPYHLAKLRIHYSRLNNIFLYRKNFMSGNYADATFVYVYLFPKAVDRLAGKFAKELASGARVLAPSFPIDLAKHPEFELIKSEKIGKITAYLYQKR